MDFLAGTFLHPGSFTLWKPLSAVCVYPVNSWFYPCLNPSNLPVVLNQSLIPTPCGRLTFGVGGGILRAWLPSIYCRSQASCSDSCASSWRKGRKLTIKEHYVGRCFQTNPRFMYRVWGHIWPKVYVYYTHLSIDFQTLLSATANPACSPKGLQFFSLWQLGLCTHMISTKRRDCFLTLLSALGFRESFC